jgi:heme-degrading monooxygenase HmoA
MYARVTSFHGQPGTTEEGIRNFESLTSQLRGIKGFISTQLLVDRTANTAIVVTLYDTLADLEAGTAFFQQSMANPSLTAILAGPPVVVVYEVAVQVAAQR